MATLSLLPRPKKADLVHLARMGKEDAFKELYFKHAGYVARMVYAITNSDSDLEDLVQEIFLGAYRSLPGLQDTEKFAAWLGKIAVRTIFAHLRRRRKVSTTNQDMDVYAAVDGEQEELRCELYRALDSLPPKLRIPWVLHRHEKMSLGETAELCEISLATVKRLIRQAERHLQERLQ